MSDAILSQLLELIVDLYDESEGFLERTDDAQLWYNRGYANGVIQGLGELGHARQVEAVVTPDRSDLIAGQELLPWGKAYGHGFDNGRRETHEVLEDRSGA